MGLLNLERLRQNKVVEEKEHFSRGQNTVSHGKTTVDLWYEW